MKNIVIIPVYKPVLSMEERISLERCLQILDRHFICLIAPEHLDVAAYARFFDDYQVKMNIERFEDKFFQGIQGYNRLMMSSRFYQRFADWEYMLVYQLDAYVFRDELDAWCRKGYDYIGAPWVYKDGTFNARIAGNGGFSLRKISSFLSLFEERGRLLTLRGLIAYFENRGLAHRMAYLCSALFGKLNTIEGLMSVNDQNEDRLFASLRYKRERAFHIPVPEESMYFSFECMPELLIRKTSGILPFGCHAWAKHLDFWREYMDLPA